MNINMPFTKGEELNINAILRIKSNATSRSISLHVEAVSHSKSESEILDTFFRLSSFTNEHQTGLIGVN
jgi:hypothetical protein